MSAPASANPTGTSALTRSRLVCRMQARVARHRSSTLPQLSSVEASRRAPALPTRSCSNPTSVEISAAAEQQHHEDDDEQSGRVHFLSCVFGDRGPASWSPLTRDEPMAIRLFAVRIAPAPNVQANSGAGLCLSLSEHCPLNSGSHHILSVTRDAQAKPLLAHCSGDTRLSMTAVDPAR